MAIVCSKCGAGISESDQFCGDCGGSPKELVESPAAVAQYADILREFAADGLLDEGELAELGELRGELGISRSTHEALVAADPRLGQSLRVSLDVDEATLTGFVAGQQGVMRARLRNDSTKTLRSVVIRYAVSGESQDREDTERMLKAAVPAVLGAVVELPRPGQYVLEAVLRAEDLLGKTQQYFKADPVAFRVGERGGAGPQNVAVHLDASAMRVAGDPLVNVGGGPISVREQGGALSEQRWAPVRLRPMTAHEWEGWLLRRDAGAVAAKHEAEVKAREHAEQLAREQAEAAARAEADALAKAKAAAEEKARRVVEERMAREAADAKAHAEAEASALTTVAALARIKAEAKARAVEAEARGRREAEQRAKAEAATRATREAEERARRDAQEREMAARRAASEAKLADLSTRLRDAAFTGDLGAIQRLLGDGVPVDARDAEGATPLFLAVRAERADAVALLLRRGASVTEATNSGLDPLLGLFVEQISDETIADGTDNFAKVRIARMLVEAGAQLRPTNPLNVTSLHLASLLGDEKAVKAALAAGADANAATRYGLTPLFLVCWSSPLADVVFRCLLDAGADPNLACRLRSADGGVSVTPLGVLALRAVERATLDDAGREAWDRTESPAVVRSAEMLLAAGARPDDGSSSTLPRFPSMSPLGMALAGGATGIALALLAAGASFPEWLDLGDGELPSPAFICRWGMVGLPTALRARGIRIPATVVLATDGNSETVALTDLARRHGSEELAAEFEALTGAFPTLPAETRKAVVLGVLAELLDQSWADRRLVVGHELKPQAPGGQAGDWAEFAWPDVGLGFGIFVCERGVRVTIPNRSCRLFQAEFSWNDVGPTLPPSVRENALGNPDALKPAWAALAVIARRSDVEVMSVGARLAAASLKAREACVQKAVAQTLAQEVDCYGAAVGRPAIPDRKLKNASLACRVVEGERVLMLYDNTVFGSATNAIVVTDAAIYVADDASNCVSGRIGWHELAQAGACELKNNHLKIRELRTYIPGSSKTLLVTAIQSLQEAARAFTG
jgi:ankyrin repeat protein